MPTSSCGAIPAPVHRVALVATLSMLAAAALVAWQPPMASIQPIRSSDRLASSKKSLHTPTIRLATNGSAVV